MRLYLDTCVLNRLTDEHVQPRVVAEAEACQKVFELIAVQGTEWTASTVLYAELRRNPDAERRADSIALLAYANDLVEVTDTAVSRARELQAAGYGDIDALHLAVAEHLRADSLLTTDDRLLRLAGRGVGSPKVEVMNPIEWLRRQGLWKQNSN